MIQKEFYRTREDGINLFRTFSTEDLYIQKVGTEEVYAEAIDVETASYTYIETNEKIEKHEPVDKMVEG